MRDSNNPQPNHITVHLLPHEWEAVQLMRNQPTSEVEMVHVPKAFYKVLEDCALSVQDMAATLSRKADMLDYLTSQCRTVE